ncbi:response regulator transcription factor [Gloeocapsa sp. PCC 73106]|uniref:response regulator transcription factor n=1 Tax=Gloeocapsa sp. PCC 73106 TaxID=102232 RepID=UPI0002ABC3B7|nr:LuxR C-terminal-related transcriptional regulator [Gloeocapsa sp. PCC 73106]ELR99269.1 response regulator containing a CheY-like receiver domain and an HTH DNA-binding domain [Gloeocapsa sp. PCC 73106]
MIKFQDCEKYLRNLDPNSSISVIDVFNSHDREFIILSFLEKDWEEVLNLLGLTHQEVFVFQVAGHSCAIAELATDFSENESQIADLLTPRELQIATLIALGRVNKQIAKQLKISEWTVATYVRRIFDKLGVDSRAAMVYRCYSLIHELSSQFAPIYSQEQEVVASVRQEQHR